MNKSLVACRICGAGDFALCYSIRGSRMVRCSACSQLQLGTIRSPDEIATEYTSAYFRRGKYVEDLACQKEQIRRVRLVTLSGLASQGTILDFGCATGDFLVEASKAYRVWGHDISQYAIDIALGRLPDHGSKLSSGVFDTSEFESSSFNAITMWDVIEHLEDPLSTIRRLARLLPIGGCLLVSTPDESSLMARLLGARWAFMTPPEHICLFSQKTLVLLLNKAGFTVENQTSKGKWVNLSFLIYKLRKVFPGLVPGFLERLLQRSSIGRGVVYVPTGDIQYAIARKQKEVEG